MKRISPWTQEELDCLPSMMISHTRITDGVLVSQLIVEMGCTNQIGEAVRAIDAESVWLDGRTVSADVIVRRSWFTGKMKENLLLQVGSKRFGLIHLGEHDRTVMEGAGV